MTGDYRTYMLSRRQRLRFNALGFLCIAAAVFLFYHSLLLAAAAGLLIRRCQPLYERYLMRRRLQKLELQFRDLLYSLSGSVAAGRQMAEALVEACGQLEQVYKPEEPIMQELRVIRKRILDNHESDRILLADLAERSGSEDIRSFVQVYLTCRNTGGDLQRIITHAIEIITEKMNIREEIRTITSQKKLEGRLICLMPAGMLLALNLMSSSYIRILYTSLAGHLIMTLCLAGTVIGVWLMEKMSEVDI